jgi:protein phosphatase
LLVTGYENIEHASVTDVGVRRSHNQDNHAILLAGDEEQWRGKGHVFLVADGMGGHAVGELASQLAAGVIPHTYYKYAHQGPVPALRKAFLEANASIHARGQANREFEGMGTTATTLLLRPEGVWVGHVGDSRAYRIRGGAIEQLSFDHSFVWEVARQRRIDPASVDAPSNVLIRSLGPVPLVQTDVEGPYPVQEGDIFLLCSDGLSGQLTDHEIGALASVLAPAEACRFLVDLANLRGGPDNITVVVVRVGKEPTNVTAPLSSSPPRKPWRPMVPWPLIALFVGILLEAGATVLVYNQLWGGAAAFFLAACVIVAGLVGLIVHYRREKKRALEDGDPPELHVYRQSSCQLDEPLVEKLVKAIQSLKQRALERQWEPDWPAYDEHYALGEKYKTQGDRFGAFREYCRAMRVLMEALQRQRHKEEMFLPVWDKQE